MAKNIVLHFGLHKTATKTLQEQFFPACGDMRLLTTLVPEMSRLVELILGKDPLYFSVRQAMDVIGPVLSNRKVNLLSNESFSGPPYAGLIERGLDHRLPILDNLRTLFPSAKSVIVIRRQDSLAKSLYRQYLTSGGTRKIREVFGLEPVKQTAYISLDRFNYGPYLDALQASFPAGCEIMVFEDFVNDSVTFLKRMTDFMGVEYPDVKLRRDNETRLGATGMEVCRILNHVFRNLINRGILPGLPRRVYGRWQITSPVEIIQRNWPIKVKGASEGDMANVGKEILELVKGHNRDLDEKYRLGLRRYGYY